MSIKKVIAISVVALAFASANAAPSSYSFSATINQTLAFGNTSMINYFGSGASVSGTFQYDNAGSYVATSSQLGYEPGYSVYSADNGGVSAFKSLQGSVGGFNFSDATGNASIANGTYLGLYDVVSLGSDPILKAGMNSLDFDNPERNFQGFSANGYKLVNVRLFWVDTAGQMVSDTSLPNLLPTRSGRMALDFIQLSDPNNASNVGFYSNTVFIDGMTVTAAVPEPSSIAMLFAGMGLIGAVVRRKAAQQA
nr:PEP-CTERM sorting domain-containing protein [uncultured Rhodoferax sp.]